MLLLSPDGATWSLSSPIDIASRARVIPLPHRRACALLAREGVTVNGLAALPIQLLNDRDEIRVDGEFFYFACDGVPQESVLQSAAPLRCARCLGDLENGDRVMRCPGCVAHHHPACWFEGNGCQKCQHPARSLVWKPEAVR